MNLLKRFIHADSSFKRYPPHTIVHYYNAPPGYDVDEMKEAIAAHGAVVPDVVKVLGTK